MPLIHAVEVHGNESQLRLLGGEDGVVGFEIAEIGSGVRWPRPPLAAGPTRQAAPPLRAVRGVELGLYEQLSALARRKIESGQ